MRRKPRSQPPCKNPLSVPCPVPYCGAPAGRHCCNDRGHALATPHPGRFRVVRGGHKRRIA